MRLLDTGGLEIRDEMRWDGLEKKKKRSFAPGDKNRNKNRKRKKGRK